MINETTSRKGLWTVEGGEGKDTEVKIALKELDKDHESPL